MNSIYYRFKNGKVQNFNIIIKRSELHMNKENIIQFLEENDLTDIEELSSSEESVLLKFFYDFDEDELKAARAYANDESEGESESEEWYDEFFLPYLSDLSVDTVGQVIEDLMEDMELEAQFTCYEIDKENHDYVEFAAVFYKPGNEIDLDKILDEIEA